MVADRRLNAYELFNSALSAFHSGDLPAAVTHLRGAFFENLYIAPVLLEEEYYPQEIWYESGEAGPEAAQAYVDRYGDGWREAPETIHFLAAVWRDPLVRAELKNFLGHSRNLLTVEAPGARADLLRERDVFLNPERIKRTQTEIIARLKVRAPKIPRPRPRLGLILLAARDPATTVRFYQELFEIEASATSETAGGYLEFEFEGITVAIHGNDRMPENDPYQLGPRPGSLGWGALFVFQVKDLERYLQNANRHGHKIVDSDLAASGRRFFVVKDPSGYLIEVTEERPRGLELYS